MSYKDAFVYIPRFPLGLRGKGHLGSSYFNTPNPEPGVEITYYLKDEIKKLKAIRKDREKAAFEKKEHVFYPSIDSLRLEDNEVDPYLLFTITDEKGNVIRNLKQSASKGINKLKWDMRYAPADPIEGRYIPKEDELFGSEPQGHLALPGRYFITMYKVKNGVTSQLVGPIGFNTKLLEQSSLPSKDFAANVDFYKKVSDLAKNLTAIDDQINRIEARLKNAENAMMDMPASTSDLVSNIYKIKQDLIPVKIKLRGDDTRSRREFETKPSINDRVFGIIGSIWNSTTEVPKIYTNDFIISEKQYLEIYPIVKELDKKVVEVEMQLSKNGAPYTPGRWPDNK